MASNIYPEFHKALMDQKAYPSAPRRIKFEETRRSYLYRTGSHVYKIRKPDHFFSGLAIKERYALEAAALMAKWSEGMASEVITVSKTDAGYQLGGEHGVVNYALRMEQLADTYWLERLVGLGKTTPALVGRLARFLAERHEAAVLDEKSAAGGRPETFQSLIDEIFYQSKKYIGETLSEALLEVVSHAMLRFLDEFRRLFLRRQKRGRIVNGHGAFIPAHIHIKSGEVLAIAPLEGNSKFRQLDAANDVATLLNEIELGGNREFSELFQQRYATTAKDRDLSRILPPYQTLQAMRSGVYHSEWLAELPKTSPAHAEVKAKAVAYFNLAAMMARTIPRPD